MEYQLESHDSVFITTMDDSTHQATVLESTLGGLYINLTGFGNITLKWDNIWTVHKLVKEKRRNASFSPRYKVLVWRNDHIEQEAS